MSEKTSFWVDNNHICQSNDVDPSIFQIFNTSDRHIHRGNLDSLPPQLQHWKEKLKEFIDDELDIGVIYYKASIPTIKNKLDLFGYTVRNSMEIFKLSVGLEIKHIEDQILRIKSLEDHYQKTLNMLRGLSPENWLDNVKIILNDSYTDIDHSKSSRGTDSLSPISYMLDHEWFGFPGTHHGAALRLILEALPDAIEILADVTDYLYKDMTDLDFNPVIDWQHMLNSNHAVNSKIIILTEGRSDSIALSESIAILYPHLADFFSFMEFENLRIGGGASNLSNWVKAFSGAGIRNKTIALFDNDTAGEIEIKKLSKLDILKNIVSLKLPHLPLFENYPTLGPSGKESMDINGKAVSIELFFGKDVLTNQDGQYFPVQWTSYEKGLKKYQGEISEKDKVNKAFKKKIKATQSDRKNIHYGHWEEMDKLLMHIFSAFDDYNLSEIASEINDFISNY